MMEIKRLPTFIKERIIKLHYTKNQTEIVNILLEEDNVKVSRQTVNMWVNHFKKTGTLIKLRKFPQKIIIMNSIYASLNILKEYVQFKGS